MTDEHNPDFRSLDRIGKAFKYSLDGLRHATAHEAAFQQELIAVAVMSVMCIALPLELLLKVLLLATHLLVLVVELLNTAIEALADKLCLEIDPLIKQAKDAGSAAVLLTLWASGLLWGYAVYTLL
jgi:diacylglycerol kinase (ATP)